MIPRTNQSPEDYRVPITPDGTVEFMPDPSTGEEQVDFRLSSLDKMAYEAIELAEPSHLANPNVIDTHRVEDVMERGGVVIDAAHRFAVSQQPERLNPTDPATLIAHGRAIQSIRSAELNEKNSPKAA